VPGSRIIPAKADRQYKGMVCSTTPSRQHSITAAGLTASSSANSCNCSASCQQQPQTMYGPLVCWRDGGQLPPPLRMLLQRAVLLAVQPPFAAQGLDRRMGVACLGEAQRQMSRLAPSLASCLQPEQRGGALVRLDVWLLLQMTWAALLPGLLLVGHWQHWPSVELRPQLPRLPAPAAGPGRSWMAHHHLQ
jgi:hypothetical protein